MLTVLYFHATLHMCLHIVNLFAAHAQVYSVLKGRQLDPSHSACQQKLVVLETLQQVRVLLVQKLPLEVILLPQAEILHSATPVLIVCKLANVTNERGQCIIKVFFKHLRCTLAMYTCSTEDHLPWLQAAFTCTSCVL